MSKNITAFRKNALALISNCGGLENAARVIDISPTYLKKIADGVEKKIAKDKRQSLKRFGSLTQSELITELSEELDWIRQEHREQLSANKEQFREFLRSPLNVYFREFEWDPPNLLEQVKKISEGEKPSTSNLAVSMYRFGALYELFRPNSIGHYSPYHGTVKTMDSIFATLSRAYNIELNISFSRFGSNILNTILAKEPLDRDEVNWNGLERDLEYVSRMIDETITEYSLKNFRYFLYGPNYFFKKSVEKFLKQHSRNISLSDDAENNITINDNSVTVLTNLGAISFTKLFLFRDQLRELESS